MMAVMSFTALLLIPVGFAMRPEISIDVVGGSRPPRSPDLSLDRIRSCTGTSPWSALPYSGDLGSLVATQVQQRLSDQGQTIFQGNAVDQFP